MALLLLLALAPLAVACNTLDEIVFDMKGVGEAIPNGAAQYDWAAAPRLAYANSPPANWTGFLVWGQVYAEEGSTPAPNTRVHLRNLKAYILSATTRTWTLVHDAASADAIDGAAYVENFVGDENVEADVRPEPPAGVAVKLQEGYNYHFWDGTGRVSIDPGDIAGVFSTVEARTVLDDAEGPDNRGQARLLVSMGADYYVDLVTEWDEWKTNGDAGIGKFKYVWPYWRSYNMHTMTEEDIRANPPPL